MPDRELEEILNAFVSSHRSSGEIIYLLVSLLHHRGLLFDNDLQALKVCFQDFLQAQGQTPDSLSYIPYQSFVDSFENKEDGPKRPILTVIDGGKKN
ncbi:MAG TPA: hypothetical protein VGF14_05290 [Alphaproteobacteria bacterium]